MFDGAKVLLTGGRGFVGRVLVGMLLERGAEVVSTVRPGHDGEGRRGDLDPAVRTVPVDLVSGDGVDVAMKGTDLVIHLAALSGGIQFQAAAQEDVFRDNVAMTRHVLDAAVAEGVGRVYLSSSAVIYRATPAPYISEDSPTVAPGVASVSGYAWSKLTDEVMGEWMGHGDTSVVIGRYTNVYGPGGSFDPARSTVIHSLVHKALAARPGGTVEVWGRGRAVRSFIHVEDCARAVLAICERGEPSRAYNVDSSDPVTIRELALLVRDTVDPSISLEFDSTKPEGAMRRVLDNSRLRGLGFRPEIDLAAGIASTVEAHPTRATA